MLINAAITFCIYGNLKWLNYSIMTAIGLLLARSNCAPWRVIPSVLQSKAIEPISWRKLWRWEAKFDIYSKNCLHKHVHSITIHERSYAVDVIDVQKYISVYCHCHCHCIELRDKHQAIYKQHVSLDRYVLLSCQIVIHFWCTMSLISEENIHLLPFRIVHMSWKYTFYGMKCCIKTEVENASSE